MKYATELQSKGAWRELLRNLSDPSWFHFIPRDYHAGRLRRSDLFVLIVAFALLTGALLSFLLPLDITANLVVSVFLLPQMLLIIFQARVWHRDRPSALILLPINLMLLAPVLAIAL
jgi:hypothetical protein